METIILMDKVQKRIFIPDEAAKKLRKLKLIEGRKSNYFVSSSVARLTDNKSEYIKNKGLEDINYKELILKYLGTYGKATREYLSGLILDKLPEVLDEKQKNKVKEYFIQYV